MKKCCNLSIGRVLFWSVVGLTAAVFAGSASAGIAQAMVRSHDPTLPSWVGKTGARKTPDERTQCRFGSPIKGDGATPATLAIQKAIDDCSAAGGGTLSFEKGEYLTGAIFLKSNVHLRIDEGVSLIASHEDRDYPRLPTRVAGIEMVWPAALINVNDAKNVKISGHGTIDGRGKKWWDKYWELRRQYEPKGLRWASDYDAERVRLLVVKDSSDVTIKDLKLRQSGFWTVQLLYSEHITVDGIRISDNGGPSTDGVDVDSSRFVLIQNCDIDNNDDDICLKSGRDSDGLRVARPTEYVFIRDNLIRRGGGVIAFGSETSGGIRHVVGLNNRAIGTKEGIRFKSAKTRGGYVEDVLIRGLKMENVAQPITFTLNWNPSYSYAVIPADAKDVPSYWKVLATPVVPAEKGYCLFKNIRIEDIEIVGAERIITAAGLPDKMIENVTLSNIKASGKEAGFIEYALNWKLENFVMTTTSANQLKITNSRRVVVKEK